MKKESLEFKQTEYQEELEEIIDEDSDEYEQFANLLNCKLCDTIRVIFPMYNMIGDFKIVKTVYNVLLEKYDEIELGALSTTLKEALGL